MCLLGNIVLTEHDFAITQTTSRNTSMESVTTLQYNKPFVSSSSYQKSFQLHNDMKFQILHCKNSTGKRE